MIQIETPSRHQILSLQEQERAFYWSRCANGLFRKHGIIQVEHHDTGQRSETAIIATRNAESTEHWSDQVLIAEGPLSNHALKRLGLTATTIREAESLWLFDENARLMGELAYSGVTTRAKPPRHRPAASDTREPNPWVSRDRRWDNRIIRFQQLSAEGPWQCRALAGSNPDDPQWPVAVSDGRRLILGLPLLDLICFAHAFVPLTESYYANIKRVETLAIERWLVEQLIDHCRAAGRPVVRVADWPAGFASALTVRHDYDRGLKDDVWTDLMNYYRSRGIRCSIGFPLNNMDPGKAKLARQKGHEVNIHSAAANAAQFAEEVGGLTGTAGTAPMGMTVHGGRGGVGFLGDVHYEWLEKAGMQWGEFVGRRNGLPFAIHRIDHEMPYCSRLISFSAHFSLDLGTRPDAHHLAELAQSLPARLADGQHVVVMNHPDIHVVELKQLIDGLDLSNTWCATFREIASWTRAAKYESHVIQENDAMIVEFPTPLPESARIWVLQPDGEVIERFCEPGCRKTENVM